ncbi:MAG: hypothetical protein HY042_00625 [Spirochaetia bacterium]|nr:hypothetical protein [Spirochaetia bacterium]
MGPLEIITLCLGTLLSAWGIFHQLIVGGAVTMLKLPAETDNRLFVMSWVAHGAFMTFAALLPCAMIVFHGVYAGAAHTVFAFSGAALIFLSGHVMVSGYKSHVRPIQIGAVLEGIFGIYLIILVALT